ERILRAEALQQIETLQAEHHTDEETAQHDDDQRAGARVVDLVNDEPRTRERGNTLREHRAEEHAHGANASQRAGQQSITGGGNAHCALPPSARRPTPSSWSR